VTPFDVAGWKEDHKRRGRADSTIAHRLSALSSYYTYLQRPQNDGRPLREHNPVHGVERDDLEVSPYQRARKLSAGEFQSILAQIDADTVARARDGATFLFHVLCARRCTEVVNLRAGDLRADDSPVFVATVGNGEYLRDYYGGQEPEGEDPLTGTAVNQALKCYASKAGLDPDSISLHSLRRLRAELFQQTSGDIRRTQLFLDHAHRNTTQIYLEQLAGEEHWHRAAMANRLGSEPAGYMARLGRTWVQGAA